LVALRIEERSKAELISHPPGGSLGEVFVRGQNFSGEDEEKKRLQRQLGPRCPRDLGLLTEPATTLHARPTSLN
jgi:hypothetical protein